MFYKIITGDRFLTAFIIFLIALLIWIPAIFSPLIIIEGKMGNAMPFFNFFGPSLEGNVFWSKLLAFILVIFQAILLVRMNARYILIQQRTFLPALFFIFISGYTPVLLQWNEVLPAGVFLILILEVIFRSYRDEPNSYRFFEAGILLGIGSLFYAPLVYMLVFIWIACMVQRPFYWREYLFPILGILVPYIFVFAFLFFWDKNISEFLVSLKSNFVFKIDFPQFRWIYWIFAAYVAFLILLSTIYLLKVFQFRKVYIRDYFMVLFWMFITASFIYMFFSGFNTGLAYIVAMPISYMLTNYFVNAKKSIGNKLLFYSLLGYVVLMALNNLFQIV
jgi:hypothetical protein